MYQNPPSMAWSLGPRTQPQALEAREPARPLLVLAAAEVDVPRYQLSAFTRIVAKSSSDVVALLARERPAALVLDADLPGFDVLAICRAACTQEATSVLVTMQAAEQAPSLLRAGCHAILLKPFAPNLLAARLGRLVRERSQQLRLRALRHSAPAGQTGTNRTCPGVTCPRCQQPNATSFEFTSHRRMWFACLACDQVWIGARQE